MRCLKGILPRSGFRTFLLALVGFYLFLVFTFHASLQGNGNSNGHSDPRGHHPRKEYSQQGMFDAIRQAESDQRNANKFAPDGTKLFPERLKKFSDREAINLMVNKDVKVNVNGVASTQTLPKFVPQKPKRDASEVCVGDEVDEFVFHPVSNDAVLFSAYWDERPNDFDNKQNSTIVRIMAVVKRGAKPDLSCVFPAQLVHGREEASSIHYYEMCENHGRPWGAYILSCRVPDTIDKPMCSVTVKFQSSALVPGDAPTEASVSIRALKPAGQQYNFATCVPPLFGKVSTYQLAEFIEVTKRLGAQHITFYDYNVGESTRAVLDHYKARGLVSVVPWMLPQFVNNAMWYYGQLLAIQDCLYRNMRSAAYVSFNDIDEFIVPHGTELYDWEDMVRHLAAPRRVGHSFISAFFDPYQTGGKGKDPKYENLTALASTQRTASFSGIRTKCMVQPYQIFEKGIHHVSKPIFANLEVAKVDEKEAFLHHYRKCVSNFGMDCSAYIKDTSLLRFADMVYAGVQDTILALLNGRS